MANLFNFLGDGIFLIGRIINYPVIMGERLGVARDEWYFPAKWGAKEPQNHLNHRGFFLFHGPWHGRVNVFFCCRDVGRRIFEKLTDIHGHQQNWLNVTGIACAGQVWRFQVHTPVALVVLVTYEGKGRWCFFFYSISLMGPFKPKHYNYRWMLLINTVDGWNPKQPPGMYETL